MSNEKTPAGAATVTTFEEYLDTYGELVYTTRGVSMEPLLRQGRDLVRIRRLDPGQRARKYDVVLYVRGGSGKQYVLHRVVDVLPDGYLILGDNCTAKERVTDAQVLGVMTEFVRGAGEQRSTGEPKTITVEDPVYQLYARAIVAVYPLRRLERVGVSKGKSVAKVLIDSIVKELTSDKTDAEKINSLLSATERLAKAVPVAPVRNVAKYVERELQQEPVGAQKDQKAAPSHVAVNRQIAQDALVYLLWCAVHGVAPEPERLVGVDWPHLRKYARFQKVAALAAYALAKLPSESIADEVPSADTLPANLPQPNTPDDSASEVDDQFVPPAVITKTEWNRWQSLLSENVRRTILFDAERAEVLRYLDSQSIWYVPLKGVVLKDYYPSFGLREFADNDILFGVSTEVSLSASTRTVKQQDELGRPAETTNKFRKNFAGSTTNRESELVELSFEEAAERVRRWFIARGYENPSYGKGAHDVYHKLPFFNFEMHRSLFASGGQPVFSAYYETVDERLLWKDEPLSSAAEPTNYLDSNNASAKACQPVAKDTKTRQSAGSSIGNVAPPNPRATYERVFTKEDFYVYFIAHAAKHLRNAGAGLRTLVDVYLYTSKESLDWSYIEGELNTLGLLTEERTLRSLSAKVFGMQQSTFNPSNTGLGSEKVQKQLNPSVDSFNQTNPQSNLSPSQSGIPDGLQDGTLNEINLAVFSETCLDEDERKLLRLMLSAGAYGTMDTRLDRQLENIGGKAASEQNALERAWSKARYFLTRLFPTSQAYRDFYPFFFEHKWALPFLPVYRLCRAAYLNRGTTILRELKTLVRK